MSYSKGIGGSGGCRCYRWVVGGAVAAGRLVAEGQEGMARGGMQQPRWVDAAATTGRAGGRRAGMAGAGIEGAPAGAMRAVERQQVGGEGLPCPRSGGSSSYSKGIGGSGSCRCYRWDVSRGQQQQGGWWRTGGGGTDEGMQQPRWVEAAATAATEGWQWRGRRGWGKGGTGSSNNREGWW